MTEICVYCGTTEPRGYCYMSPDGSCHMDDAGPDYVDPGNVCHECGLLLDQAELDGFCEHVCDPGRIADYKAWLADQDTEEWDYRG